MFTFFPLYLFFLEKIYVFIKISHCSSSENCSLTHIWKPSRWLWSLAVFLIIRNASLEPVVNPLCKTGGSIRWGGGEEEDGEMVQQHCDPERCHPLRWPVSWAGQREHGAAAPSDMGNGWAPSRPTILLCPHRATGHSGDRATPLLGLLLLAAACLLRTHLEIMAAE